MLVVKPFFFFLKLNPFLFFPPKQNLMQRPRTKKNFSLSGVEILAGPIGITLPRLRLYPGGLEGSLEAGLGEARAL